MMSVSTFKSATVINDLIVRDIRFPTGKDGHGSDAMHVSPDYSCAYVELHTDTELTGCGITFTTGRGNELVCSAVMALRPLVIGKQLSDIYGNFAGFYRILSSDDQLRWVGPEKGVIHLATAAVLNALWDLWAKIKGKPLWKLLVDMTPEELVSVVDFRYLTDFITREEAIEIFQKMQVGKIEREAKMRDQGYPGYTTSCGWMGYSDDRIRKLSKAALDEGFTKFKLKVGAAVEDDQRRCRIIREVIGYDRDLMTDANQRWDVGEAIEWMKQLAEYKPLWIEEPTSPDDILGHAVIAKALNPLGIGVATGEQCHNRIMFKQFLQAGAMQYCQIDSCRVGSLNENIAILLMAAKAGVPVCPHAGGVGLCELVQHIAIFDYISVSGTLENRVIEYIDHLHEHFVDPIVMKRAHYQLPQVAGYSCEMKEQSLKDYAYPGGKIWKESD